MALKVSDLDIDISTLSDPLLAADDVNEGVQAPLFTLPEDEKSFTTLVNDPSLNDFRKCSHDS